jgi:hypothetical protein
MVSSHSLPRDGRGGREERSRGAQQRRGESEKGRGAAAWRKGPLGAVRKGARRR